MEIMSKMKEYIWHITNVLKSDSYTGKKNTKELSKNKNFKIMDDFSGNMCHFITFYNILESKYYTSYTKCKDTDIPKGKTTNPEPHSW